MQTVAAGWLMFELTRSAVAVSSPAFWPPSRSARWSSERRSTRSGSGTPSWSVRPASLHSALGRSPTPGGPSRTPGRSRTALAKAGGVPATGWTGFRWQNRVTS